MLLRKSYDLFIQDKKSYCESPSVLYYRENVTRFLEFLEDEFNLTDTSQLTKDVFVAYITHLRNQSIKNTSIHTYIRAVKVFLKYCHDNEWIAKDITNRVKLPKSDAALKVPLSSAEVDKIDSLFQLDEKGMRNYLIFHCMLDMGLRRSEVINLQVSDINFDDKYMIINKSKNNKSRIVPVPELLLEYIRTYTTRYKNTTHVFMQLRERVPLNDNTVKQLFQDLKIQSGIPRLHAHLLRHTFASSYMLYRGDIYMLKILMGHSDIYTTEKYVHIANQMKLINYDIYKIDDVFIKRT